MRMNKKKGLCKGENILQYVDLQFASWSWQFVVFVALAAAVDPTALLNCGYDDLFFVFVWLDICTLVVY